MANLKKREIEVQIQLDKRLLFSGGGNLKIINGLAISANIIKYGDFTCGNSTTIEILGMRKSDCELLTKLNFTWQTIYNNVISIAAGYDGKLLEVFTGNIIKTTYKIQSNPSMTFFCETAIFNSIQQKKTLSLAGSIYVSTLFQKLATDINLKLVGEKYLAGLKITNPVLEGSTVDQLRQLADSCNITFNIDSKILEINPTVNSIDKSIVKISADSGMIGYPTFDERGVIVTVYFDKNIRINDPILIQSSISHANAIWRIYQINYKLENYGNDFMMTLYGQYITKKI